MGEGAKMSLLLTITLLLLGIVATSNCLESRRGVIQRNNDPVCGSDCDRYYLQPDSMYAFIYLRGYDFYPYLDKHVEVTGTQGLCAACRVLNVIEITFVPPVSAVDGEEYLPRELSLDQNFPNPFNPRTDIQFALPRSQYVTLTVTNTSGQAVATLVDGFQRAGGHTVSWDPSRQAGISSGLYYYRLQAGSATHVRKMLLLR